MLKTIAASQAAKTLAFCVCPIVTASVVATKEPHVRRMIHRATAPKASPARPRAAVAAADLPPCDAVAPFATLPRVSAALPAAVGIPGVETPLTATGPAAPIARGAAFNPGFGAPGAIGLNPGGIIGGGGGGGGVIPPPPPPGGGEVIIPPTSPVSGVPEPETWAQIFGGFALAGGTVRYLRQRRRAKLKLTA